MENRFVRFGVRSISRSLLVPVVERLEAYRNNLLRILVYHRIGEPGSSTGQLDPTLLSATPEQFERQMRFLRENYQLLSIADVLRMVDTHQPLPPRAIIVTFDDGYHDFLDIAWPILEANQIPVLLFLATGFVSRPGRLFWWDLLYQGIQHTKCTSLKLPTIGNYSLPDKEHRWKAFIELKQRICCLDNSSVVQLLDGILEQLHVTPETKNLLLSWDEARYLHARGCDLAAHTRNHTILTRISMEEARQEIRQSREDVCREIGTDWPVFAYPSGHTLDCSKDLTGILQAEGCKLVMSSIPGINVFPNCNTMQLKRIGFSPRIDQQEYRMVLTGIYHLYCTTQERVFHQG